MRFSAVISGPPTFKIEHGGKAMYVAFCEETPVAVVSRRINQAIFYLTGERSGTVEDFLIGDNVRLSRGYDRRVHDAGVVVAIYYVEGKIRVQSEHGETVDPPEAWEWADPAESLHR